MSFKDEMKIDKFALDEECANQPVFFHEMAKAEADAKDLEDKAKEVLRVIEAETELTIRSNPDKYKIAKITESMVKATIAVQPEYKGAMTAYLKAKHNTAIIKAGTLSLHQKSTHISDLVRLHIKDYYSEPMIDKNTKGDVDNLRESTVKQRIRQRRSEKKED